MRLSRAPWVAVAIVAGSMSLPARESAASDLLVNGHELVERRGVMIEMRDGVRLAADLYMPNASQPLPVLLMITPYGRGTQWIATKARWFAQRGYVAAVADSRGRNDSQGDWDPFSSKHRDDGGALVEWLARQPWSSGRVGMFGPSYMGWNQWWTAATSPPHLGAIAPVSAPGDHFENGPYQHGALLGGWLPDWAAANAGRVVGSIDASTREKWERRRLVDLKQTPYKDIVIRRGVGDAQWFSTWYAQNRSSDAYWREIAYQSSEDYSAITAPALNITGWFDVSHSGAPMNYVGMRKFGATERARRPSLIIGPWSHEINERVSGSIDFGPGATFDVDGYQLRWFDHYLKGSENGVEKEPSVHLFVMGKNVWRTASDWPLPETRYVKYFFASAGRANSSKGNGQLTTGLPRRDGSDVYRYNPREPTLDPYNGTLRGPADTRQSSLADDVLVYQTPPLETAVEVIGPIEATLFAATSAKDTDWMIRLVDVRPDGYALLLADGVIRARNRDPQEHGRFNAAQLSPVEPGQVYQYTIRFWRGTANLFGRGHRIRVEVSSSWFPSFLPNLNTGADNLATVSISEAVIARQTIFHGARFPSHILLPVIADSDQPRVSQAYSRTGRAKTRQDTVAQ